MQILPYIANREPNELPLETEHVAYGYVVRQSFDGETIILIEIVRCKYKHPSAPDDAYIWQLEDNILMRARTNSIKAAPIMLLKHIREIIDTILNR